MSLYNVNNYGIGTLLNWVSSGEIAIPEIQRPFVWDATKVRDLIDSLYRQYPVGYIIVWQSSDVKLKDGSLSVGKKILIDGQQRITALTAAILGEQVIGTDYKKKNIKIAFNILEEKFEVYNPVMEKSPEWVSDISDIFTPNFNTFDFVPKYLEKIKEKNIEELTAGDINNRILNLINLKNSQIGIIELDHKLDIEIVTEIFIRINSKGVVLSQSDFAMSKIAVNEIYDGNKIRKTIDYFCHILKNPSDLEIIKKNDKEFSISEYMKAIEWIKSNKDDIYVPDYTDVLRVAFTSKFYRGKTSDLVSLLSGRNFETRVYEERIIEESFRKLKEGILDFVNKTNFERFLMILKSSGIIERKLVKSQNVLNFGYILYLILKEKGIDSNKIEKMVSKWIIFSILTGRYSSSPETAFEYDIKRMSLDCEKFMMDEIKSQMTDEFWGYTVPKNLESSITTSPFFNLFIMAQIKIGNRCFLAKNHTVRALIENRGDIHHIFPKKYLQNNGKNNRNEYNQVANYVYIQSENNIKISDKNPKEYFNEILRDVTAGASRLTSLDNEEDLYKNLSENAIPSSIFEMDVSNYEVFLEERRKLMSKKIKDYFEGFIL